MQQLLIARNTAPMVGSKICIASYFTKFKAKLASIIDIPLSAAIVLIILQ